MVRNTLRPASFALALSGASLFGAAACSGGGGGGGDSADAGFLADAGARADAASRPDAAVAEVCADVANFSDLGAIDGEVLAAEGYLSIDATLDEGPPQDLFVVELYAGVPPFEAGITTGTFEITGDQGDYNVCGVCATVFGDIADNDMVYVAQSGTINVTSIAGNFTGSFVPAGGGTASFVGYRLDEGTETFIKQDSCTITGGGATWDKAIPAE